MGRRAVIVLSTVLMSCSAIASFDGLVGTAEDGGNDGSVVDASARVDGSLGSSDGMSGVDATNAMDSAGADAGSVSDGANVDATKNDATVAFCAANPGHTFCDDFDTQSLASKNWILNTTNGTVAVDTVEFLSPPKSVIASSPSTGGGAGDNFIEQDFSSGSTIAIEGALKLVGTTTACDFVAIEFKTVPGIYNRCYFDISYDNSANNVLEAECDQPDGGGYYQSAFISHLAPAWDRFKLAVDLTNNKVSAQQNGGAVVSVSIPSGLVFSGGYQAEIGVLYDGDTGTCIVHVDNVLIDKP